MECRSEICGWEIWSLKCGFDEYCDLVYPTRIGDVECGRWMGNAAKHQPNAIHFVELLAGEIHLAW